MADTAQLQGMLDNLINDKTEQAQINFHSYLQDKMREVLGKDVPATSTKNKQEQ